MASKRSCRGPASKRARVLGPALFVAILLVALGAGAGASAKRAEQTKAAVADSQTARKLGHRFWKRHQGKLPFRHSGHRRSVALKRGKLPRTFALDGRLIRGTLARSTVVSIPAPDGTFQRFAISAADVMAPALAAEHPEIRTYEGQGIDDPTADLRITTSPLGFQASVRGSKLGAWYIDPVYRRDSSVYASYLGSDLVNRHGPLTETPDAADAKAITGQDTTGGTDAGVSIGTQIRDYRLALVSDPGYAAYFGAANVTAAKVALMNRVDQIYNSDLDINMTLIADSDLLNLNTYADAIMPNGPCGTAACFELDDVTSCGSATLNRLDTVVGQIVGAEKFDIGHIALGKAGGGIAALGVVGRSGKAEGCTGVPEPVGDFYAVDYVAHEMGHQFSGNHTFNGTQKNCSTTNRNGRTSVEPGSGSSIMAYAGICGQDDLQPHSDPYFSQRSFDEITAYTASNRAAVSEVQSVALRHFGGGNEVQKAAFGPGFVAKTATTVTGSTSFQMQYGATTSATIGGNTGLTFTDANIKTAIDAILGGGSVTVTDAASALGFTVTFDGGAVAGTDVPTLQIVNVAGCTGCEPSVQETNHGGTDDTFQVKYGANTSVATIDHGGPASFTLGNLQLAVTQVLTPAGLSGVVNRFGGGVGSLDEQGFQVTFASTQDIPQKLEIVNLTPPASALVNELTHGGPVANKGNTITPTGNHPPSVSTASSAYTIPYRTPFALSGTGTDSDGDPLTYMWEQNDPGPLVVNGGTGLVSRTKTNGPLFRQFGTRLNSALYDVHDYNAAGENLTSASDSTRVFPDLAQILDANTNAKTGDCPDGAGPPAPTAVPVHLVDCLSEWLPSAGYAGPMHFRLTARDGRTGGGGLASADTTVNLAAGTGPFLVTSPDTAVSYRGNTNQRFTWTVAGTNGALINAANVKISLSTDGGITFSTVLAPSTPNDGSEIIRLPNIDTTAARVKIEPTNNVFFDISDADFSIATGPPADQKITFPELAGRRIDSSDFNVSATSDSFLPVSFTAGGACTVSGTLVHLVKVGTCSLTARQGGDSGYNPAPDVTRSFDVGRRATKLALRLSRKKVERGDRLRITARAFPAKVRITGKIIFKLGKKKIRRVTLKNHRAKASLVIRKAPGRYKITATYLPSGGKFTASRATKRLRVVR